MAFFNSAVTVLQTLVIALGAGLGIWGAINLLEGYGNDNPGAKSQGMKQIITRQKEHGSMMHHTELFIGLLLLEMCAAQDSSVWTGAMNSATI